MGAYRDIAGHYHAVATPVSERDEIREPTYLVIEGTETLTYLAREAWSALAHVAVGRTRADYDTVTALHAKVAEWDDATADTITDDEDGMDYEVTYCTFAGHLDAYCLREWARGYGEVPPVTAEWFSGDLARDAARAYDEAGMRHEIAMSAFGMGPGEGAASEAELDATEDWWVFAAVLEAQLLCAQDEAA